MGNKARRQKRSKKLYKNRANNFKQKISPTSNECDTNESQETQCVAHSTVDIDNQDQTDEQDEVTPVLKQKNTRAPNENDTSESQNISVEAMEETSKNTLNDGDTVANKIGMCITCDTETTPVRVEGRRIINMQHFYNKLQEVSTHGPLNCGLAAVVVTSEKTIGLKSILSLKCTMCNMTFIVDTDEGSEMDINKSAVAGTVVTGCGLSQFQELSAALDLPVMSQKVYQQCHHRISNAWDQISVETMNDAAQKERELAVKDGRVDASGIPIIDVIVDGCWCKRTYKKNYSALSGAAAIIGKRTGLVLYLGVKNKYCSVCAQAQKKSVTPQDHTCYKNYVGPSTGMESAILVDGFKCSVEMHGLIYGRMVSDGDSSTYSKILQARPYAHVTVQKIECRNHVLRNLCNKLIQIKTETKHLLRFRKNVTEPKVMTIRKTIRKAINKYKTDSESERSANVELLYNDILLSHLHAFGDHSRCKAYFCDKPKENTNQIENFFTSSVWSRVCQIISTAASHAPSLIYDVDSNAVERLNSVIAKFVGGKRVNFSLKNSYEIRCKGALVSFNTRKLLSATYKHCTGRSPRGKIRHLEEKRTRHLILQKKYNRKKRRIPFLNGEDADYGSNCVKEDISNEMMEKRKETKLNSLKKTEDERNTIQKETILQSGSSDWMDLRRNLLTASNFGRVIKKRSDISCANLVRDLLYKECISHVKSIKHGKDNEPVALEELAQKQNIKIIPCGLFIDPEIPFLGATPDGLTEDGEMIVEVKCSSSGFTMSFEDAVAKGKIPIYKKLKNGNIELNKKSNWYYQIQGQLHVTRKSKAIFGLWLGHNNLKVEVIERDDHLWKTEMEEKLKRFYMECILPELVDARHTRNMCIRDPPYIQEAIRNRENVKKKKEAQKRKHDENKDSQDTRNTENPKKTKKNKRKHEENDESKSVQNAENVKKKKETHKRKHEENEDTQNAENLKKTKQNHKIKHNETEESENVGNGEIEAAKEQNRSKRILREKQLSFQEF